MGSATVSIDKLVPFQGELKELSEKAYRQCKESILTHGFSEPITVWENPDDILYVIGGHQRLKTLVRMRGEGFSIPNIPICYVDCKNNRDAKEKVLALTSAYGKMTQESLLTFCQLDLQTDMDEMLEKYRFADLEIEIGNEKPEKEKKEKEESEVTTIRVKVGHSDRDRAIEKIKIALVGMNPDIL